MGNAVFISKIDTVYLSPLIINLLNVIYIYFVFTIKY